MNEEAEQQYSGKVVRFPVALGHTPPTSGLKGGGGGGTFDGMEPRIAALEVHVENLKTSVADLKASVEAGRVDVGTVKVNLATLTERVANLPSKGFIISVVLGILTVITALIAFQRQIQDLVGTY
jgi:hypothetical protein